VKRCAWGFREQYCRRPTDEVFCRNHRAIVNSWVEQAEQTVAAIDLARRDAT